MSRLPALAYLAWCLARTCAQQAHVGADRHKAIARLERPGRLFSIAHHGAAGQSQCVDALRALGDLLQRINAAER